MCIYSQDKNGTVTQVVKSDNNRIDTVCTGICSTGRSTETVITGECKIVNEKPEWVDEDEKILTEEKVNTTYERECRTCEDIKTKDPGDLFKWNCTLKVLRRVIWITF